jgi:hypothetical protein
MMTAIAPMIIESTFIIERISLPTPVAPLEQSWPPAVPVDEKSILDPWHKQVLVSLGLTLDPLVQSTAITVAGMAAVKAKVITAVMLIRIDLIF